MKKGFTLIELIVAISIIAVVATTVYVNIRGNQAVARDARRKADLSAVRTAVELYRVKNGTYPSTAGVASCLSSGGTNWCGETSHYGGKCYIDGCSPGPYIPGLAPIYISVLPSDPLKGRSTDTVNCGPSVTHAGYVYTSDGTDYKMAAFCTVEQQVQLGDPFQDPHRPNIAVYAVYSAGARDW